MPGMTSIRETHEVAARTGKGFGVEGRRCDPDHRSRRIPARGFLGLQQGRSPGVPLLRAHQAFHREAVFPTSAIPPTPTGGAGSSRWWTTPRQASTTCQYAACDPTRYAELGVEGYHESCQENLHTALGRRRHRAPIHAAALEPVHQFLHQPGWQPSPSRRRSPSRATTSC